MRLISVLCLLMVAPALSAQEALPKRPKLPRDADTNDARAYANAVRIDARDFSTTPWDKLHDAYYWAARLEPNVPEYYYARYVALLNRQPDQWYFEWINGAEYVMKSKTAKLIDSLYADAVQRAPFARFDLPCRDPGLTAQIKDPLTAGIWHYRRDCFQFAVQKLREALAADSSLVLTRLTLARALFFTQQYRDAAVEIQVVLDSLRARDQKYLGQWYNSKEFLERSLALALLRARDIPGARAALGRALTEDLSYYPAHATLAQIAMDQGQIPMALQEAELAVGLEENDGVLRYDYGVLLFRSGKIAEAEEQFKKAAELEPYWAEARRQLAVTLDRQDKRDEAIAAYEAFLARAPKRENVRIKEAQDRIAALRPGS
jgi:Tfp pilus assembly protein PilF